MGRTSAIATVPGHPELAKLRLLLLPDPIPYDPLRLEKSLLARTRQPYDLSPSAQDHIFMIVNILGFFVKPSYGMVLLHRFHMRIRMHVRQSTSLLRIVIPEILWMGGEPSRGSEMIL
ncbi:hypothetical protein MBLNU13_g04396t1 [Cladosporium sp. NU13]